MLLDAGGRRSKHGQWRPGILCQATEIFRCAKATRQGSQHAPQGLFPKSKEEGSGKHFQVALTCVSGVYVHPHAHDAFITIYT